MNLVNMKHYSGNASIFGMPGDAMMGGNLACLHRLPKSKDLGVAHRTLECGTKVVVSNPRTHKWVAATVYDHGPYGAIYNGHWVLKRKNTDPGKYRGEVDLLPATAKALHHNGFEKVDLYVLDNPRMYQKYHRFVQK